MTTQHLIERLQAIQNAAGCAVEVAVAIGDELPDVDSVIEAFNGGDRLAIVKIKNENLIIDVLART